MSDKKPLLFGMGALASGGTAALTTLCCVVPLAAGTLGAGAASLGAFLEPYRPYFMGLTLALLGFAFYQAYKPCGESCEDGAACATPRGRRRQRILVWIITAFALVLATSPYWSSWLVYLSL